MARKRLKHDEIGELVEVVEKVCLDFASQILKPMKLSKLSMYLNCELLLPTTIFLKIFFSLAGRVFNELRQSMTPMTRRAIGSCLLMLKIDG